jgi:hypothetical protein
MVDDVNAQVGELALRLFELRVDAAPKPLAIVAA